jgi:hypothetical protein
MSLPLRLRDLITPPLLMALEAGWLGVLNSRINMVFIFCLVYYKSTKVSLQKTKTKTKKKSKK